MLVIVGPTAVGKTRVALEAARALGGELISADSMAVYRGLDIGTAKPTLAERGGVPCHLIDVVEPTETFSAAAFRDLAKSVIAECRSRNALPVIAGGTGFYVRALLDGLGLAGVPADPAVRHELRLQAERLGTKHLYERLVVVDPVSARRIHPNDAVRIVRALEVWQVSGRTLTQIAEEESRTRKPLPAVRIGLRMDVRVLDQRINERVDAMFGAGLVDEVGNVLARGVDPDAPGLRGLGYKEVVSYLRGMITLPECVDMVKRNTRRYARRQMTWFRADRAIQWFDVTERTASEIANQVVAVYSDVPRRTPRR